MFDLEEFNEWLNEPKYDSMPHYFLYIQSEEVALNIERYMPNFEIFLNEGYYNLLLIKDYYNETDVTAPVLLAFDGKEGFIEIPFEDNEEDEHLNALKEVIPEYSKRGYLDLNELKVKHKWSEGRRNVVFIVTEDHYNKEIDMKNISEEKMNAIKKASIATNILFGLIYLTIAFFAILQYPNLIYMFIFLITLFIPYLFHYNILTKMKNEKFAYARYLK